MTPAEAFRAARLSCGLTATEWAAALGYASANPRQLIHDMESGRKTVTPSIARLAEMLRRYGVPSDFVASRPNAERPRSSIPAPPEGVDRDDAAYDMVRPHIEALVHTAEAAGWHPAEVLTGNICATADLMREGAGSAAAIETIKGVLDTLKSQRDT